jgi:hemolysin activation/secretion protein
MINTTSRWFAGVAGIAALSCALAAHGQGQAEPANPIGHFEIARFEVQGNTLLPAGYIDGLLAPYAGRDRDFGSVQKAVEALEAAYRDKGYNIVRVVLPEQELNHGVVQLRVIEARIGHVKVEGNQHFDEANIRHSLPALVEGQTPNVVRLSTQLKLANEEPAKKTTVQLQTGERDDQVDALLQVTDEKPWSAGLVVDNTGDENTGRNHVSVMMQNANVGGVDHVLSLQYTTSFAEPGNVHIFGAGYHLPLYTLGDSLDFYGSYSDVNAGTINVGVGVDLAVSGKGSVVGGRYNHNLLKVGDYESKVMLGFDYKDFQNDVSADGTALGNHVTVHPLSLTYAGTWSPIGSVLSFYVSGFRNVPGGDNGGSADFSAARGGATDNYSLLRYNATYLKALPQDWQLRFVLNGQITSDALVQGEQFGAGGVNSVRGFLEREIANDEGRTTNLELYTPNVCSGGAQCRLLGFYDTGYISRNDALAGEITSQSIGSIGLGARLVRAPYIVVQADAAHVVDGTALSPKGSNRVHFRVVLTY